LLVVDLSGQSFLALLFLVQIYSHTLNQKLCQQRYRTNKSGSFFGSRVVI